MEDSCLNMEKKAEIETISLDDLYNNLKIYEPELTGSSSTSQNLQNVVFVSTNRTNSTSNTNEADDTAYGVSTAHTQDDLEQIDPDDLKEMDLHWEMAILTIKARRFIKRTGRNLDINGQKIGFDRSKVECFNCHKNEHFAKECRAPNNQENKGREYGKKTVPVENPTKNALIAQYGFGGNSSSSDSEKLEKAEKEIDELKLTLENYQNSSKSLNTLLESQVSDKVKTGLRYKAASPTVEDFVNSSKMIENQENVKSRSNKGYHAVPLPYTGNCRPPKPNLMFIDKQVESKSMDVVSNVSSSAVKTIESKVKSVDVKNKGVYNTVETKTVKKNSFSPPIIEDGNFDDESEVEFKPKVEVKTVRPSIEKIKFVKTAREKVEMVETPKQYKHYPKGNQRNWSNLISQRLGSNFKMINKACFVCGSFEHLQYDCDKRVVRPVWNNSKRVNHKNFVNKMTHPHPKRRFIPQAILTKSGKLKTVGTPVNTVRPVNTADSKPIMNYLRPISNDFKRGYSQAIRPFNKYSAYNKAILNKEVNAVKASTCWVWKAKHSSASNISRNILTLMHEADPIIGGFQTNGIIGTKYNIVAGQSEKKKEFEQEYILIPICTFDPLIFQGPKDSALDVGKKATEVHENQVSDNGRQDDQVTRSEFKGILQQERQTEHINSTNSFIIVSSPVNNAGPSFVNAASPSPINAAGTPTSTNAFEDILLNDFLLLEMHFLFHMFLL
uniref:Ribonuclease H-like domain-containing protein n=1 Tax=Tanacetum cinerariifolium TaxID=118510 RepID=A0A6L2LSF6_TANCI|nr:ribonuclease H-like domain-containing protein [Tanacetum cinerariifolium]